VPPTLQAHQQHLATLRAAALRAADPAEAVRGNLKPADVAEVERVFIVGAGKAGAAMAQAAIEMVGDKLVGGVMAVPHLPFPSRRPPEGGRWARGESEPLNYFQGGHPLPTEGSLAAGRAIAELLSQTTPRDLVLALISGGGSALMELPKPGLTLSDLQITNHQLLKCGATIHEFNSVRKALSQIKGGGLLKLAAPAQVLGLILSDVVGNDLSIIASGPTVETANNTSPLEIIERYQLTAALPRTVLQILREPSVPIRSSISQSVFNNRLIASNRHAGEAAAQAARELGFTVELMGDDWQGEAREVGARFAQKLLAVHRPSSPVALIAGGESTVTVRGAGKGGRNQEAALAAAQVLAGHPQIVVSTFGTDGVDGPTDAAGATVTGETAARARALGLELQTFLENNDAYNFFAALGDLVITGPTGTNVNDLLFGLAY